MSESAPHESPAGTDRAAAAAAESAAAYEKYVRNAPKTYEAASTPEATESTPAEDSVEPSRQESGSGGLIGLLKRLLRVP